MHMKGLLDLKAQHALGALVQRRYQWKISDKSAIIGTQFASQPRGCAVALQYTAVRRTTGARISGGHRLAG
jgi:hypothetical protein